MQKTIFTKKQAERVLAQRRLQEHYGLSLSGKEYKGIIRCIAASTRSNPTATLIERQSQRVSVWEVLFGSIVLRAVYDRHRNEIVTFLPPDNYSDLVAA